MFTKCLRNRSQSTHAKTNPGKLSSISWTKAKNIFLLLPSLNKNYLPSWTHGHFIHLSFHHESNQDNNRRTSGLQELVHHCHKKSFRSSSPDSVSGVQSIVPLRHICIQWLIFALTRSDHDPASMYWISGLPDFLFILKRTHLAFLFKRIA